MRSTVFWGSGQRRWQILLVATDLAFVAAVISLTRLLDPFALATPALDAKALAIWWVALSMPHVALFYLIGLYDFRSLRAWQPVLPTLLGLAIFFAVVGMIFASIPVRTLAVLRLVTMYVLILVVLLIASRMLVLVSAAALTRRPKLLVLGWTDRAKAIARTLAEFPERTFEIARVAILDPNDAESIVTTIKDTGIDAIAMELPAHPLQDFAVAELVRRHLGGTPVYDLPAVYAVTFGRVPLDYVDARWLMAAIARDTVRARHFRVKRLVDMFVSVAALIGLSPFIVLIALAIMLDSRGGVLFRQERLGHNRRPFECMKFRTMRANAEALTGPVWSQDNDPRITRVGRFLRATRLDEVPQLLNVFRGEMTLVGPRPIREHFALLLEQQIPFYDVRFTVKPGLTGWAQVNYGYAGSEDDQRIKFEYELFYLQSFSLLMDAFILFKTLRSVILRTGK